MESQERNCKDQSAVFCYEPRLKAEPDPVMYHSLLVNRIWIIDRNRKVLCFRPDCTLFKSVDPMVEYSGVNKVQSHPDFDRQSQLFWTRPDRTLLRWRTRLVYEPTFIITNRIRFRIAIGTSVACTCLLFAITMWSPPSMARIVFVLKVLIWFVFKCFNMRGI